jgi:hypothetical protein
VIGFSPWYAVSCPASGRSGCAIGSPVSFFAALTDGRGVAT